MSNYSSLFSRIGLGNLDIGYIILAMMVLIVLLLVLLVIQIIKSSRLKKRLDKFITGKDGESLEQDIISLYDINKNLKESVADNRNDIRALYKSMESAYRKMGLVKYDAFQQMGGQLSYSLALLNDNNDGFIMNSVHSTDGCYSYTKEVKGGESTVILSKEEEKALNIAIGEK